LHEQDVCFKGDSSDLDAGLGYHLLDTRPLTAGPIVRVTHNARFRDQIPHDPGPTRNRQGIVSLMRAVYDYCR